MRIKELEAERDELKQKLIAANQSNEVYRIQVQELLEAARIRRESE